MKGGKSLELQVLSSTWDALAHPVKKWPKMGFFPCNELVKVFIDFLEGWKNKSRLKVPGLQMKLTKKGTENP